MLSQFQHSTKIKFFGFSKQDFKGNKRYTIFMEYAEYGSLDKILDKIRQSIAPIDYEQHKCPIILIGIARSMMLLHKHKIIHGDLKPSNILLDKNYLPKLTDFQDSRVENTQITYTTLYSAPEVLLNLQFSEKSDVFSFGIIMYEVITNLFPYSDLINRSYHVSQNIINGDRPKFTAPIKESLKNLIEQCWSHNPKDRPSFEEIFYKLAYDQNYYFNDIQFNEIMDYIDTIKSDLIFCTVCKEKIEPLETLYYSGNPYHKRCIKCIECQCSFTENNMLDDFICITPGLFMCRQHYENYQRMPKLSENLLQLYQDKKLENIINEKFDQPIFNSDNILDYKPDEIFIDSNMIENSFQIDKPYEYFIPTVKLHFDKSANKVDFDTLQELFGDGIKIIKVESGSTFLKIAFLSSNIFNNADTNLNLLLAPLREKLNSAIGQSIIGNFIDEPEIELTNDIQINDICKIKSSNLLQNPIDLEEIELNYLKKEALRFLSNENIYKNWSFLFQNHALFDEAEKQVRSDIQKNAFEMVIIGQTIIQNKYFAQYNEIKRQIPPNNVFEGFLYHGTRIANHQKIIKTHFYMPGVDKEIKQIDFGFFGVGIYATENLFYASYYANYCNLLKINEKASIICCRVIYDKSKIIEIKDLSFYGVKIDPKIANKFGIHHTVVGDSVYYHPISLSPNNRNVIVAGEYVFPNKYQIIPICSFIVMRTDYFILWKDENIENNENTNYMKELSREIQVNIYFKRQLDDAINLINLKKLNRIKLITNGGAQLTGKKLIEEARKIIKSNFVCLVFASDIRHYEWVSQMENVLFTNNPVFFREFARLNMNMADVLDFIHKLEEFSQLRFNINQDELLNFPLHIQDKFNRYYEDNYIKNNSTENDSNRRNDDKPKTKKKCVIF